MLYGGTTRALLLYLDFHDVIRVHWSPLLLVETHRALIKTERLTREAAALDEAAMSGAAPRASVSVADVQRSFRKAWPGVRDAKDLHVAATAVALLSAGRYPAASGVHLITKNSKDFAPKKLASLDVLQRHPDVFLLDLWQRDAARMAAAFAMFRGDLPARPDVDRVLHKLASDGQRKTATAMLDAHRAGLVAL